MREQKCSVRCDVYTIEGVIKATREPDLRQNYFDNGNSKIIFLIK